MNDLSDDILFLIGDQLLLPDLLNLSFTCRQIYTAFHRTSYRSREKAIYHLHDTMENNVYMAAQANLPLLLRLYLEQWEYAKDIFGDFWLQVGLGAAVGGHLDLVKLFLIHSIGNASDVLAAAIRYKHWDICNFLITKKVVMNEDCTQAIAQGGHSNMFVKMILYNYYIPVRDFPILCIHGFNDNYPKKCYYALIMFALQNSPKDFMPKLFDVFSDDDDDLDDYHKILANCLQGPYCVIDHLVACGFNNWPSACIATMMNSQLLLFDDFIIKITDINHLKPIVKYAVEHCLKDFLIICEYKHPSIRPYIIKTCKKLNRPTLQCIFDINNSDIAI